MLREFNKQTGRNLYTKGYVYEEETLRDQEAVKKDSLERIKVTTTSGKVFYGDPVSRTDLSDAIDLAAETGKTSVLWKLAEPVSDSRIVDVTVDELKEARMLALDAKAKIIGVQV